MSGYEETRTPYVYRLFDADGVLLYVGSSINPGARFERHQREQPWWPDVAAWTLEDRPSLDDARVAEQLAIQAEQPRHNKLRYDVLTKPWRGGRHMRRVRLDGDDWDDLGAVAEAMDLDRGWVIRQLVRWYLGREGAEPPRQPGGQR